MLAESRLRCPRLTAGRLLRADRIGCGYACRGSGAGRASRVSQGVGWLFSYCRAKYGRPPGSNDPCDQVALLQRADARPDGECALPPVLPRRPRSLDLTIGLADRVGEDSEIARKRSDRGSGSSTFFRSVLAHDQLSV